MSIIKQIYRPTQLVGQVYARPYGTASALAECGNTLALELTHEEDVKKQPDMRRGGGGTYAQSRRIKEVNLKMELADWNAVNFARSVFGSASVVAGAAITDEAHVAYKGGLIRLAHISPTLVTVKKGVTVIDPVNYEVRAEGIYVPVDTPNITDADALVISYTHPEHVDIEALTTSAPELELSFGGLNEADSGTPTIVDIWRLGAGVAKTLALIQNDFGTLTIEGEVLSDPRKSGVGISRFYRAQMG